VTVPFARFFDEVGASAAMRRLVVAELSTPTRRWHGLLHHALMLRLVARSPHRGADRRRLILATLFHDIVYDAARHDNEATSAAVARTWVAADDADAVARLILATRAHELDTDPVTRTLLEADLAVLWTPSRRLYAFYAAGIRAEYAHVPEPEYRRGRSAVMVRLRGLAAHLDEPRATMLTRNIDGELAALS